MARIHTRFFAIFSERGQVSGLGVNICHVTDAGDPEREMVCVGLYSRAAPSDVALARDEVDMFGVMNPDEARELAHDLLAAALHAASAGRGEVPS